MCEKKQECGEVSRNVRSNTTVAQRLLCSNSGSCRQLDSRVSPGCRFAPGCITRDSLPLTSSSNMSTLTLTCDNRYLSIRDCGGSDSTTVCNLNDADCIMRRHPSSMHFYCRHFYIFKYPSVYSSRGKDFKCCFHRPAYNIPDIF